MADYNTLNLQQKITGAMPGALANYGVSNPPTTANDRDALNQGIGSLDASIIFLKSQAQTLATQLGISLTQAYNYSIPISSAPELATELAPFIPAGYTVSSISLGEILNVTEGVKSEFINLENQLQQGNIIPQDGIDDPDDDDDTDDDTGDTPPVEEPPIVEDGEDDPDPTPVPQPIQTPQNVDDGTQSGENSALSSFKNNLLGAFTSDVYLRDYTHAAKTFIPNKFSNAPKVKFLFHVAFNINSNAWKPAQALNTGVLVKNVKLPSFRFDTDTLNQYNRKRIIQSKIKYDPAEIVFHDDNASQITSMWNAYYRYYYADSWNPNLTKGANKRYNRRNIYDASLTDDMQYGYRGDSMKMDDRAGEKAAFFDDITVYGLWNNNYIAYTFINPIITNFSHDTYAYAEAEGTMSNTMTIDYETVTYNTGVFSLTDDKVTNAVTDTAAGNPIPGYALQAHYDYTESPNEDLGFNNTLGGIDDMFSALGGDGSIGDKIKAGAQFANNFDKDKIIANAKNAVKDGLKDAILSSITGGLFGGGDDEKSVPTGATSGGMVNISNQGGVTGARNGPGGTDEAAAATAGSQNFGDSLVSNISRNLGFGG